MNIDFDGNMLHHANNLELIQHVTVQLEKQLKGRLLITPALTIVGAIQTRSSHIKISCLNTALKSNQSFI